LAEKSFHCFIAVEDLSLCEYEQLIDTASDAILKQKCFPSL